MVLPQWGLTSKLQRLFFYETLVLNSADSFQNPPTAAIPEPFKDKFGIQWMVNYDGKAITS